MPRKNIFLPVVASCSDSSAQARRSHRGSSGSVDPAASAAGSCSSVDSVDRQPAAAALAAVGSSLWVFRSLILSTFFGFLRVVSVRRVLLLAPCQTIVFSMNKIELLLVFFLLSFFGLLYCDESYIVINIIMLACAQFNIFSLFYIYIQVANCTRDIIF